MIPSLIQKPPERLQCFSVSRNLSFQLLQQIQEEEEFEVIDGFVKSTILAFVALFYEDYDTCLVILCFDANSLTPVIETRRKDFKFY